MNNRPTQEARDSVFLWLVDKNPSALKASAFAEAIQFKLKSMTSQYDIGYSLGRWPVAGARW